MNLAGLRLPVDNTAGKLPRSFGLESAPQLWLSFPKDLPVLSLQGAVCALSLPSTQMAHTASPVLTQVPQVKALLCAFLFFFFLEFFDCATRHAGS